MIVTVEHIPRILGEAVLDVTRTTTTTHVRVQHGALTSAMLHDAYALLTQEEITTWLAAAGLTATADPIAHYGDRPAAPHLVPPPLRS